MRTLVLLSLLLICAVCLTALPHAAPFTSVTLAQRRGQAQRKRDIDISKPDAKPQPAQHPENDRPTKAPGTDQQQRVALVIGNSAYARPLPNPVNDSQLIGKTLRNLRFNVIEQENLTRAGMQEAIRTFGQQLRNGGVGLFYYAGHGVQVGGRNYLVPINYGRISTVKDVDSELLDVGQVFKEMAPKSGLNIVILDACRNTPSQLDLSSELGQGFAEIRDAPSGSFVAFSTAPGHIADDGSSGNSPYTQALASNLLMRPSRLEDVFMRTRIESERATSGQQVPWENSSAKSVFYFTPDEAALTTEIRVASVSLLKKQLLGGLLNGLHQNEFNVPVINERGTATTRQIGRAAYFSETAGGMAIEIVEVPSGKFQMGSNAADAEQAFVDAKKYNDEATKETVTAEMPQHAVNVEGFFMGKNEITQGQWRAVMGKVPDIDPRLRGDNLPVVNITWHEATEFCAKLSQMTGRQYRLPTEAEWEYACRAGTATLFAFGKNITPQLVMYNPLLPFGEVPKGPARNSMAAVGQGGVPNLFGLYDMHGNVWEWCADKWHDSYDNAPTDGSVWDAGDSRYRVARGGSWDSLANRSRSASRGKYPPFFKSSKVGFRVVVS